MPLTKIHCWLFTLILILFGNTVAQTQTVSAPSSYPNLEIRSAKQPETRIELQTTYWDLYAPAEDIYLQSLERLPEGVGVQLKLHSPKKVLFFRYAINGNTFQKTVDGTIHVRFEQTDHPETQYSTTVLIAVFADHSTSTPHTININYYPGAQYAASGQTDPGRIIVHQTDISLKPPFVQNGKPRNTSRAEKDFARYTWGHLIAPDRTDYDNAIALAESLIKELHPHVGIPSDQMYALHPFQQYLRVKDGNDQLWCTNISEIFAYACNSLGIACRSIVATNTLASDTKEYKLVFGQGHRTTEIFSRQLNQWIWMDLSFYILGAYIGPTGPINLAEFHMFLNNPNRLASLNVIEYDPALGAQERSAVMASTACADLFNYFKRNQRFYYPTENLEPIP